MRAQPLVMAGAVCALLGMVFFAAHVGWHGFSIDHKLNPVLLATLAVNIFIAYFLQFYLAPRASDSRAEKDILIDGLRDVLASTRQCRDTLMLCHDAGKISAEHAKLVKTHFRKIANGLDHVSTALAMSQCAKLAEDCKAIQDALFNYKSAATGGNFHPRLMILTLSAIKSKLIDNSVKNCTNWFSRSIGRGEPSPR